MAARKQSSAIEREGRKARSEARKVARKTATEARKVAHTTGVEARKAGRHAGVGARKATREVERGAESPWLERASRFGYVVRGLLYGAMGAFGMGFAIGVWHQTTDQRGALYLLAGSPFKIVIFGAVIIGLVGYSAWGFLRAIFDPLHRGDEPTGIAARLGFAWSGLSYAGLLVFALEFLTGLTRGNGSDSIEKPVRFLLAHPFGVFLTLAVGAIAVLAGLGQFWDGITAGFSKDLKRSTMSKEEKRVVDSLGRFGMFSRGVIFTMLGAFVVQAALHDDAARAKGMGAAFQVIAQQPMGHFLLFVVSLGFVALALHSFASARWIRMMKG
jgi:hypothetical protein